MLSGNSCRRLNSLNWLRHELVNEALVLFQLPSNLSKLQKKSYTDYSNITNLGYAWDYIMENPNVKIDTMQIRKIHSILSKNTSIESKGGVYRLSDFYSERLGVQSPHFSKIIYYMDDIQYKISDKTIQPLIKAFNTHYDIIYTQPFEDFNKRTARMIMNWILIQNGYRPIMFNYKSDKIEYMKTLYDRAHGDCKSYSRYLYLCLSRTQKDLIKMLRNSKIL